MLSDDPFPGREVSFTVAGEPATKSRARVVVRGGKARAFTPAKTKEAEARMRAAFLEEVQRLAPSARYAFGVEATFYMASGMRRDVDNMIKVVLDGLNKVAWADDWQVIDIVGRKRTVPKGHERTEVRIYTTGTIQERVAQCEQCAKTFPRPPSHAAKKYCSDECRRLARLARIKRTCDQCGSAFHANSAGQKHCSIECSNKSKHVEVSCAACDRAFTKARSLVRSGNHYCSDECKATYWRERRRSAPKGSCKDCGGPTTKKTYIRCRDCQYAAGGRHAYTGHEVTP